MERADGLPWEPRPRATAPWADARIAHLKTRWLEGVSVPAISREIGISRNSAPGKFRRPSVVELSPHGARGTRRPPTENRHASRRGPADSPVVTRLGNQYSRPVRVTAATLHVDHPRVDADVGSRQGCSFLELNCRTCRWPVGDPGSCDFFFCGAEPVQGKPYCAAHCLRAYRPAQETVSRPRSARLRRAMLKFRGIDTYIKLGGETAMELQCVGESQ